MILCFFFIGCKVNAECLGSDQCDDGFVCNEALTCVPAAKDGGGLKDGSIDADAGPNLKAPGSLDPNFGGPLTGTATLAIPGFITRSITADSEGHLLIAGDLVSNQSTVIRVKPDGSGLDPTFGVDGLATINIFQVADLKVDGTGRIIGVGWHGSGVGSVSVRRLDRDGFADSAYPSDAVGTVSGKGKAVAIDDAGGAIVAVQEREFFAALKLDNAGDLIWQIREPIPSGSSWSLVVVDDALYLGGRCHTNATFAVARYDANSRERPTDGFTETLSRETVPASGNYTITEMAAFPDGAILAGGATSRGWTLLKIRPDGSLDGDFSGNGMLIVRLTGPLQTRIGAIELDESQRVLAGVLIDGVLAVVRYLPDGQADPTFTGDPGQRIQVGMVGTSTIAGLEISASCTRHQNTGFVCASSADKGHVILRRFLVH